MNVLMTQLPTKALTKTAIDNVFDAAEHHVQALDALYKLALEDAWGNIQDMDGWPKVSKNTWKYIAEKFTALGGVAAGLLWMNKGFSHREKMLDWWVRPAPVLLRS
jgi:hypothetical protein